MHLHIIGFGNQAQAWAHNLKDSNVEVTIVLRPKSPSTAHAAQDFKVITISEIPEKASIALLTPDDTHQNLLIELDSKLHEATLIYAHGHSVVSQNLAVKFPQFDHLLFAPKGIAKAIREHYLAKLPLAAVMSLEFSRNKKEHHEFLIQIGQDLGISQIYECTFEQETQADLFSEQSLLCSVLPYAANLSFKLLRQKGIPAELAYLECWYEIKLIADAMVKMGPKNFFDLISPNALYGSQLGQVDLIDSKFQKTLEKLFNNIENKNFDHQVKQVDMEKTREEISKFWEDQELTSVHEKIGPKLY